MPISFRKLFLRPTACSWILLTTLVLAPNCFSQRASADSSTRLMNRKGFSLQRHSEYDFDTRVVFAYWNDDLLFNSIINNLFRRKVISTTDDNLTANFWVRVEAEKEGEKNWVDAYLNIITSKMNNYRSDLLSIRMIHETTTLKDVWHYGAGIVTSGNFGGSSIQNGYHSFAGFSNVSLPYTHEKYFGISFYGSVKPIVWTYKEITLTSPFSASFLTNKGPSFVEGGFSGMYGFSGWTDFEIRTHVGFVDYYQNDALFAPFFGKGMLWSVMLSDKITEEFNVSVWMSDNQYGQQHQHFGLALSSSFISIVDDVRFP